MPIDGLNMKATATIVEIRGTFTGTITCADGTYIEVLNNTPALTPEAAKLAIRRLAQLVGIQITRIYPAKSPATSAGSRDAFPNTREEIFEAAEREVRADAMRRRIERIRLADLNRKGFDAWTRRNMAAGRRAEAAQQAAGRKAGAA